MAYRFHGLLALRCPKEFLTPLAQLLFVLPQALGPGPFLGFLGFLDPGRPLVLADLSQTEPATA